jgi:hypothetical protein
MLITLTALQRLQLEGLLSVQKGNLGDLEVLADIRRKIRLPAEDRDHCIKSLPDGRVLIDLPALEQVPALEVELEKEERRRLLDLLTKWDQFTTADVEWLLPVRKQLAA